jgi:3-phenylpropionate/trans-cinnamate dioxygenase ferredoxin reductase subunit
MDVVVLEMADRILQRVTAPELSEFYTRIHREEGVKIHTGIRFCNFGDGRVEKVICSNGAEFVLMSSLLAWVYYPMLN